MKDYKDMSPQELMIQLGEICEQLNWMIAIPATKENVPGLVIGTEEFILLISEPIHDAMKDFYELDYQDEQQEKFGMEVISKTPSKKRDDFH